LIKDINLINEFISDNKYPIVPISAKKQINIKNLYLEIGTKTNALTGKELQELKIPMDKYEKINSWIRE